jgi:hypothetical protein
LKSDPSANESPFHRHSTLLGMLASLVVVAALGWATHWRVQLVAVYGIAFIVSFLLFARLFYGFRASRRLDKELVSPESGWDWKGALMNEIDKPGLKLERAYEKAHHGDASDFRRLAEDEQSSQAREGDSTTS